MKTKEENRLKKIFKDYAAEVNELAKPLITDPESPYFYDGKRANHALQFIEKFCRHSKGKWGGKLVVLELWQKAFITKTSFPYFDYKNEFPYCRFRLIKVYNFHKYNHFA